MANNILDRYGIKEVCDVTFYDIDNDGNPTTPVYYFDTLKVSTIEQTSENTSARGGKGNPELIIWDYNKEITLTIEDALFSPKSLALMMGAQNSNIPNVKIDDSEAMTFTRRRGSEQLVSNTSATNKFDFKIFDTNYTVQSASFYTADGSSATTPTTYDPEDTTWDYVTFTINSDNKQVIEISPDKFAGTYYITGDTYARNEATGKDELFQFICPKGKVNTENTLTMEAEGDPSTYEMTVKVMKPKKGSMLSLVKYELKN